MNDFDLFSQCIRNINVAQEAAIASEKLEVLKSRNTPLYLTLASQFILQFFSQSNPTITKDDINCIIMSLTAIKNAIIPKRVEPITNMINNWFSENPNVKQMRDLVKKSIAYSISCPIIPIRKMASATLSAVLKIEGIAWGDIIPYVLTSRSEVDPFNVTSIMVFNEIFNYKVIPNRIKFDEIQKEIYTNLITIIFNILRCLNSEVISLYIKLESAHCLRNLIAYGNENLFTKSLTNEVLDLIFFLIKNDNINPDLYREFHFIMLEFIKLLYAHIPEFSDKIYSITEFGMQSPILDFKIISYHFWSKVWKYEKKYIFNIRNKIVPHRIVRHYSPNLINIGIKLIASIDPSSKFLLSENECNPILYISYTLKRVFKSCLSKEDVDFQQHFEKIVEIIEKLLSANEQTHETNYNLQHFTAVILIKSLIFNHRVINIYDFIVSKIPIICQFATSSKNLFLSDASLNLLTSMVANYESILKFPGNRVNIFDVIEQTSKFSNFTLLNDSVNLMYALCQHLSYEIIDDNFDFFIQILSDKLMNYHILTNNVVFDIYRAFEMLIFKSSNKSEIKLTILIEKILSIVDIKSFTVNSRLFYIPTILASNEQQPIDPSTFDSNPDINFYLYKEKTFIIRLYTIILRKFQNVEKYFPYILENILFKILEIPNSAYFDDALGAVCDILKRIKDDFMTYAPKYMQIIKCCLHSHDFNKIKNAARCFGWMCEILGSKIGEYVKDEIFTLFKIMISLDDFTSIQIINYLLIAFSKIMLGLKDYIVSEMDFIMNLFNYSLSLINFYINLDDENEAEFAVSFYKSICLLFISLVKILPPNVIDQSFIRAVKNKLFPIFAKIFDLRSYNLDLQLAALDLLVTLGDLLRGNINMALNRKYVSSLLDWIGINCADLMDYDQKNDVFGKINFIKGL